MMNKRTNNPSDRSDTNSRAPQNARVTVRSDTAPNEYRLHLSHTMRVCRYAVSALLLLVILITSCVYSDDINYENASRLLSGLKMEFDDPYQTNTSLDFGTDSVFGVLRSVPISFSERRLTFFGKGTSPDSAFDISDDIKQVLFSSSHVLLASDSAVYVYNSSGLYDTAVYDGPLYGICKGNDEGFAVIHRISGTRCAVDVYDGDADMIYRWTTADKTVTDVYLHGNILTLTVIEDADTDTPYKILSVNTRTSDTVCIGSFGKAPLYTHFFDDGAYCIAYADSCEYYSASANIIHTLHTDSDISGFYASDTSVCIVSKDTTLYITDTDGQNTKQISLNTTPNKIRLYGASVFLIYPDTVERISSQGERTTYPTADALDVVEVADDSFAVFYKNEIKSLN